METEDRKPEILEYRGRVSKCPKCHSSNTDFMQFGIDKYYRCWNPDCGHKWQKKANRKADGTLSPKKKVTS